MGPAGHCVDLELAMKRLLIALTVAATLVAGAQINSPGETAVTSSGSDDPSGTLATLSPDEIVLANYVHSVSANCVGTGNGNGGNGKHRLEWSFTASDIPGVPGGVVITSAATTDGALSIGSTGPTVTANNGDDNNGSCGDNASTSFTSTITGMLDNGGTFTVTLTGINP